MPRPSAAVLGLSAALAAASARSATPRLDESPGAPGEWGFRPSSDSVVRTTPPAFAWRPQKGAASYDLQCARGGDFRPDSYTAEGVKWNVHCPPEAFQAGAWSWRFRARWEDGSASAWSTARAFRIAEDAGHLALPTQEALLARIPQAHPRLFVRPEQIPDLKQRAQGDLRASFDGLVTESEKLMASPPPTAEPPKYGPQSEMPRGSDAWRKVWWGNRTYTSKALNAAATLAFTRLLGGKEEYGHLAHRILMACAQWDPKGATGYRYNDEAGMPYNYYFARTYTFVNDLLTEDERQTCRQVIQVRGDEMFRHLCPRHLWRPYASHSNRAWHFLGEVGIAFHGEIPEAGTWTWFAANVFANVYPVWCDEDGGWHEGMGYWRSYITRFTWWADVMRTALGINAFDKPYFSQIGFYPLYMQPPGTKGGGFGDLTAHLHSGQNRQVMSVFAAQASNPYWQWYVDAHGGPQTTGGYIGFVRGALPAVTSRPPTDLPTSRCFQGTGQAVLNATLFDAAENVQIILKSSPFGTQSHGYESQNSFLMYAFGERLFIRTGRRDSYGSKHHKQWMWQTKSTNCLTVNGRGQRGHSAGARGEITDFSTSPDFDFVTGEAAAAYEGELARFTRRILFIKPEIVLLFDTVVAPEPSSFQWFLHAPVEMDVRGQHDVRLTNGRAACRAAFLWPPDLKLSQTDRFDPPPRPRIKLTEYHLTAEPATPSRRQTFVTVLRPHLAGEPLRGEPRIEQLEGGLALRVPVRDGHVRVLCRARDSGTIGGMGIRADAEMAAVRFDAGGMIRGRFLNRGTELVAEEE